MAIDSELLEILACPLCKRSEGRVAFRKPGVRLFATSYRENFAAKNRVVEQGLQWREVSTRLSDCQRHSGHAVDEAFDEA